MLKSNKRIGNEAENILDTLCRYQGITIKKIPDGCRTIGRGRLIRVKSPFDRILAYKGSVAFVDYKTTQLAAFPRSMVDLNQLSHLLDLSGADLVAGYLVWFREQNIISFFDAHQLFALPSGQSLSYGAGKFCGSTLDPKLTVLFNRTDAARATDGPT